MPSKMRLFACLLLDRSRSCDVRCDEAVHERLPSTYERDANIVEPPQHIALVADLYCGGRSANSERVSLLLPHAVAAHKDSNINQGMTLSLHNARTTTGRCSKWLIATRRDKCFSYDTRKPLAH